MTVCARRSSSGSVFGRGFDSPRLHQESQANLFGSSGSFPYRSYNMKRKEVGMSMKQTIRLKRAGAVHCAGALILSLLPATLAAKPPLKK